MQLQVHAFMNRQAPPLTLNRDNLRTGGAYAGIKYHTIPGDCAFSKPPVVSGDSLYTRRLAQHICWPLLCVLCDMHCHVPWRRRGS